MPATYIRGSQTQNKHMIYCHFEFKNLQKGKGNKLYDYCAFVLLFFRFLSLFLFLFCELPAPAHPFSLGCQRKQVQQTVLAFW